MTLAQLVVHPQVEAVSAAQCVTACLTCVMLVVLCAVVQCLRLLGGLTAVRTPPDELLPGRMWPCVAPNAAAIVQEMQATSMVSQCIL